MNDTQSSTHGVARGVLRNIIQSCFLAGLQMTNFPCMEEKDGVGVDYFFFVCVCVAEFMVKGGQGGMDII